MRTIFNGFPKIQRKIAWLLIFSTSSLCLVGWLIYSNRENVRSEGSWVAHTYSVIEQIEQIDSQLAEGEAFSLRYSISGGDSIRSAMQQFHGVLEQHLSQLEE